MNLTPNSFSDGGELQQLSSLESKIQLWDSFLSNGDAILDWGALSTAPQNAHAANQDHASEWKRIQTLIPLIPRFKTLSIDTFRPEILRNLLTLAGENQSWIWNDVSGHLDSVGVELLKDHPHMSYVLCHNLSPSRDHTPWHKDFTVEGDDFFISVLSWFSDKIESYQQYGLKNPLYLDPCFGFSKNYRQNWELIERFEEFASTFHDFPLVVGISRKSFLKDRFLSDHPEHQELERVRINPLLDQYQEKWHVWFDQVIKQPCFFRLHHPPHKGSIA